MKKLLLLVVIALTLAACSAKDSARQPEPVIDDGGNTEDVEATDETTEEEPEVELEPLTIDADEFVEKYNEYADTFDVEHIDDGSTVMVNEKAIGMYLGSLSDIPPFFNALADVVDKSDKRKVLDVIDAITTGLDEDGFYANEIELENENIDVSAVDASAITITVKER